MLDRPLESEPKFFDPPITRAVRIDEALFYSEEDW